MMPHLYSQIIFNQGSNSIPWRGGKSLHKWCQDPWVSTGKEQNWTLTSHPEQKSTQRELKISMLKVLKL